MGAKVREIRRRIRSVQSTRKITKAMELIAASRILRAERRVRQARPFAQKMEQVIRDLAATTERLEHPLLEQRGGFGGGAAERDERRDSAQRRTPRADEGPAGLVVITADRGLAGAYNANVLRLAERTRRELGQASIYVVGRKGISAFRFRRIQMEGQWAGFSESPDYQDARDIAQKVIGDFLSGRIGSARIISTDFVSMFTQQPTATEVLPVKASELEGGRAFPPVYEFEPEPAGILEELLPMYVETKIFQALLEAAASEHAARRRAMSSATENAEKLITHLTRVGNQARQSEITMEIADIVGGAEALRKSMSRAGS